MTIEIQKTLRGGEYMKIKHIIFILLLILIPLSVWSIKANATTQAHISICFCHNVLHNPRTICTSNQGEIHGHQAHVKTGFDTLGVCQVTPIPTVTVTPTISFTPTQTPCIGWKGEFEESCINVPSTITLIATPTSTPEVTQTPHESDNISDNKGSDPQATEAHGVVCTVDFEKPIINKVMIENNGSITWSWLESTPVDHFSIIYGKNTNPDSWIYGADNLKLIKDPITQEYSVNVKGLDLHTVSWAQVWAWKDGCAEKSNVFDP